MCLKRRVVDGFPIRLREARHSAGLTLSALAHAIGVQLQSIWRWEHGRAMPQFDAVSRIATVCRVEIQWLGSGEGPMHRDSKPSCEPRVAALPEGIRPSRRVRRTAC